VAIFTSGRPVSATIVKLLRDFQLQTNVAVQAV